MAQPSTTDLVAPFDPTAYSSLTFAQLFQLVSGLYAYTDKGFVVTTTDVAGVPEVPNANVTLKWKQYLWRRISATTVTIYVWNPNAASDATYLQWVSINIAGIGVGSIVNAMIADNTITDVKIANLDYSKLLNAPTGLPPSGNAGGDLTGTYPSPSIDALAVTTDKIADEAVTHDQLGPEAVEIETDIKPNGVGLTIPRTNAGATAVEWAQLDIVELANPTGAEALKNVRVNAAGTAFEYAASGSTLQTVAKLVSGGDTTNTAIPYDNTIPQITEGKEYVSLAVVPLSATSLLRIRFTAIVAGQPTGAKTTLAVFESGTANAIQAVVAYTTNGDPVVLTIDVVIPSNGNKTYSIRFGPDASNDSYINRAAAGAIFGAAARSYLIIDEVQGTLS